MWINANLTKLALCVGAGIGSAALCFAPMQSWADAPVVARPAALLTVGPKNQPPYKVRAPNLSLELSANREILGLVLGHQSPVLAVRGDSRLAGCHTEASVTATKLADGGLEFTRVVGKNAQRQCTVVHPLRK